VQAPRRGPTQMAALIWGAMGRQKAWEGLLAGRRRPAADPAPRSGRRLRRASSKSARGAWRAYAQRTGRVPGTSVTDGQV